MADFDLQQTDQQVQNILNDGQSAMGAGAQTTLTTEYVMLKDVNGVYHKILKDSLTEACRNVLAGLLVNNDKGTTINQIPAIASGDLGSVTPANLASVLGAEYNKGNGWFTGNPDTITETCCAPVHTQNNSYFANLVGSTDSYWMLETRVYGTFKIQKLIGFWGSGCYIRTTQEAGLYPPDWWKIDGQSITVTTQQ